MDWKKLLGSIPASVDEELRLRNTYLAAENRLLRPQISGRVPLTDGDRRTLAALGPKLGKQALEEIATVAKTNNDPRLAPHVRGPTGEASPAPEVCWPSSCCPGD